MELLNYLKKKRTELLQTKQSVSKDDEVDNIQIIIENSNNMFENEAQLIKDGAKTFLENGSVSNIEEGIIVFATMIRGLKYTKTEKDENGNVKIVLKDISLEDVIEKKK